MIRSFTFQFVYRKMAYTFAGTRTEPTDKEFDHGGVQGGDTYRLTHVETHDWNYAVPLALNPDAHWRSLSGGVRREIIARVRMGLNNILKDE